LKDGEKIGYRRTDRWTDRRTDRRTDRVNEFNRAIFFSKICSNNCLYIFCFCFSSLCSVFLHTIMQTSEIGQVHLPWINYTTFFFKFIQNRYVLTLRTIFFFINKLYYFIRTFHWCDDSVLLISHRDYYVDFCSDRFFWFLNKTCEMKDDWCELNQNLVPEIKFNEIKKFWQIQK
jgi:hypothetical protein